MCDTLEILGKPDERVKVLAACDWLAGLSPSARQLIGQQVRRVAVINMGDHAFLPIEKTVLIVGEWLHSSSVETIARLLTRGARYIQNCEKQRQFRMWSINSRDIASILVEAEVKM